MRCSVCRVFFTSFKNILPEIGVCMSLLALLSGASSLHNEQIVLRLTNYQVSDASCGIEDGYLFHIYKRHSLRKMGYISLRLGESRGLYYLGHIGYRIDEPYRGHGYAAQACELLNPIMREEGLLSVVITTDTDNWASRRTCEKIGCILESVVPVPEEFRVMCSGSTAKCRYIYFPFGR